MRDSGRLRDLSKAVAVREAVVGVVVSRVAGRPVGVRDWEGEWWVQHCGVSSEEERTREM